jgi:tRNA A58 N-methylase Trm61
MSKSGPYVLGTNPAEQRRLQQQSLDFASRSAWLLDQAGIRPGLRVIDVGCGPAGVLGLMAASVGEGGSVFGLEQNPEHASRAAAGVNWTRLAQATSVDVE